MLDTVVLQVYYPNYTIVRHELFRPSTINLFNSKAGYAKFVNNSASKVGYYPRLTIYRRSLKRGESFPLLIEFSVTKLLLGNNLEEVSGNDFEKIIQILASTLNKMGVYVSEVTLKLAAVSAVHFSKNIILKGGYTVNYVLNELAKVPINKKFDIERVKFRNSGELLSFYSKSNSIVFYDKAAEILDSQKMVAPRIERFIRNHPEILRIEIRITQRKKLKQLLINFDGGDTVFKNIFSKELSKKVLIYYWEKIISEKSRFLFDIESSPSRMVNKLIKVNPKIKLRKALFLLGLKTVLKDVGVRAYGNFAEKYNGSWAKLKGELAYFKDPSYQILTHGFIDQIGSELVNFQIMKDSEN